MADDEELPPNVQDILKTASMEILSKQKGCCFTVKNTSNDTEENSYVSSYNSEELAEFINFDMLGEEGENLEAFNNLITDTNHEDLTGDRKVLKILLDPGIGEIVPENSVVLIHYIAYISNLHEPFDVTYLRGRRPKRYTLGVGDLLLGLEIGIKTMRTGENARFIIKPEYAYREMGCPPRIPPNATILFDVHLVTYLSTENCYYFDENNRDPERFNKNLLQAKKLHMEGNEQFKLQCIDKAIFKYERAKELLHVTGCNDDSEEVEMMRYLNKLYTNLSVCYLKQCAFNKVCRMGIEGMKYSERFSKHSVKLLFNWGKALRLLKDFKDAKNKLQKALKLEPRNETIKCEIMKLEKDKEFNSNTLSFTFNDDNELGSNERLPLEFWELFDKRMIDFLNSSDDILTIMLNKNPDDIELVKHKGNSLNLECQVITKAGVETNCIAIKKKELN